MNTGFIQHSSSGHTHNGASGNSYRRKQNQHSRQYGRKENANPNESNTQEKSKRINYAQPANGARESQIQSHGFSETELLSSLENKSERTYVNYLSNAGDVQTAKSGFSTTALKSPPFNQSNAMGRTMRTRNNENCGKKQPHLDSTN